MMAETRNKRIQPALAAEARENARHYWESKVAKQGARAPTPAEHNLSLAIEALEKIEQTEYPSASNVAHVSEVLGLLASCRIIARRALYAIRAGGSE